MTARTIHTLPPESGSTESFEVECDDCGYWEVTTSMAKPVTLRDRHNVRSHEDA
jgi:hypothetical protein